MKNASTDEDILFAARHALFWLVVGNAVGFWLALLLIFPQLNFGGFNYGRLLPVHLNLQLYGWSSLPLVAFLFHIYPARRGSETVAGRAAVLSWSIALVIGITSWLAGQNSGKIFLEWTGVARTCFASVLLFLWVSLASRWWLHRCWVKFLGLAVLLPVPILWYWASSPHVYPAIDPSTAGPTGSSLLGSTLSVVLLLLIVGPVLAERVSSRWRSAAWIVFGAQVLIFALAEKGNSSHASMEQIAILGSLLVWVPLMPAYFREFEFPPSSRKWLLAALGWFALLTLTGWLSFLPRILDSMKFTNGLVAHSHLAMAGFVTAFNLFLLSALLSPSLQSRGLWWWWNGATLTYILLMWVAGGMEAADPAFTILPGIPRTLLYSGRAFCGGVMLLCSFCWFRAIMPSRMNPQFAQPFSKPQLLAA